MVVVVSQKNVVHDREIETESKNHNQLTIQVPTQARQFPEPVSFVSDTSPEEDDLSIACVSFLCQ